MASDEYRWLQEQGNLIAEFYPLRWIAVDGARIAANPSAIASIVVSTGATLEETVSALDPTYDPLTLFYVFIRPTLETHERQEGWQGGNQRSL
jgi:hypothetical protein